MVTIANLTIRNVDEATHDRLRALAARHGRSVEAEVRGILAAAVDAPTRNVLLELQARTADVPTELDLPARRDLPREVDLP
ncbi:hypothetical protein GCM10022199_04110 [Marihabitans asiaticum]|uniref:Antitoxin FitA-like ribbon-helix-helix domain-containing protein n=1 Tax=Marihabitans asiaticum TaxID=415218 RepID=A0A560WEA4_9MICO|nr:toxin-antitoxin system antitoxin subunit [Marihabitans asiaticum]TWD15916.1 hypothetical protein FB557_1454 [Marihabitans asiaticum]